MSLRPILRSFALLLGMAILLIGLSAPATAHKEHKKQKPVAAQVVQPEAQLAKPVTSDQAAMHARMGEEMDGMDMGMDRSKMSFFERMLDWFGRLHPAIVHFPIAFFPAALFTAVVGRRRPAFAAPVQFLVVAGGIFAPIAAAAGWFAGIGADPEPIVAYHRWLGVAIGIAGAGLGVWAWVRPGQDRSAGMLIALTVMTVAIAIQGFLGAGITHGVDHLMF